MSVKTKHDRREQRGRKLVKLPRGASPEDAYFYTKEWQAKEREADAAIARGEISGPFETADETIAALRAARRPKRRPSRQCSRRR